MSPRPPGSRSPAGSGSRSWSATTPARSACSPLVRVKSPSAAPNWWVVLMRRNTRRCFRVVPAASCTWAVNGWLWAMVDGAEVISGRLLTSTYQGSNRSTSGWTLPRLGLPPTRMARPVWSSHMLEWYWWAAQVGATASIRLETGRYSCAAWTGCPGVLAAGQQHPPVQQGRVRQVHGRLAEARARLVHRVGRGVQVDQRRGGHVAAGRHDLPPLAEGHEERRPLIAPVGVQPAHRLEAAGQRPQESHPDGQAAEAHPGEEEPSTGGRQHVGVGGHAQPVGRDAPGATGMVVDLRLGVERTRAVEARPETTNTSPLPSCVAPGYQRSPRP